MTTYINMTLPPPNKATTTICACFSIPDFLIGIERIRRGYKAPEGTCSRLGLPIKTAILIVFDIANLLSLFFIVTVSWMMVKTVKRATDNLMMDWVKEGMRWRDELGQLQESKREMERKKNMHGMWRKAAICRQTPEWFWWEIKEFD